ncbi:hypothetical protein SAMN05192559_11715 [Halobacillus karajensis]|uniref:hypothetical protein n=1 Tax=Halobacillus karajensis TaxID=195088 RepID=UPI0008A799D9|nr:hypothetical protein [Halobacillus karajensis]SEI13356.1 hypothetical protein SAMN05192559_11715 [Halobacillus karajensis]
MFNKLFKRKSQPKDSQESTDSQLDPTKLKEDLERYEHQLESEGDHEEQIHLQNKIGEIHYQLNEVDEAIECWNRSVNMMDKPGYAHTKLMQAYNYLQKESWKKGDIKAGEHYAEMVEKLMKHNKDSIRYGKKSNF